MYKHFFKRILDFFCALAAIVCLSTLLVVLTLVGAVKMKGNPFFTQPPTGFKAFHPRCHCTSCMRLRLGNNMYHKEWDRAMTRTILFDEFAEDIKKEREATAAEANARADKEKSRADEANARADKYAAILKEHGLL